MENKQNEKVEKKVRQKPKTAYQELVSILYNFKTNKITLQEAIGLVQLRELLKPSRPYCKVMEDGTVTLYGIKNEGIQMFGDEWDSLIEIMKKGYVERYLKHNERRIKKSDLTSYSKSLFSEDSEDVPLNDES
jgi:hypothetical protein